MKRDGVHKKAPKAAGPHMLILVLCSMCDGELLSVTHAHINQLSLEGIIEIFKSRHFSLTFLQL